MSDTIYQRLAQYLDSFPGRFPPTDDGLHLRILERLFTPEQAALALHLTLMPEEAEKIAARAGLPHEKVASMLDEMAGLGLITDLRRREKPPRYMAAQFVIGIWEYQVNRLTPELARDVGEYLDRAFDLENWRVNPQLRTIPIGADIAAPGQVLIYEDAEQIVRSHQRFAVAECICRLEQKLVGAGCDKPLEVCLVMGGGADLYIRHRRAREISMDEALEVLRIANREALVLQPGNSQDAGNICCCCGDCCGVLRNAKRHPQPARVLSSPFYAQSDPGMCDLCLDCLERCQMEAIRTDDGYAVVDRERCIGCGLCVPTCSTGAMQLQRKPLEEAPIVPGSGMEQYRRLARPNV
jgi:ferredoxin